MSKINLIPLLRFINPDEDYNIWINVGMALKHEGYPMKVWEEWSSKGSKFHEGECEKKWGTFNKNTSEIVTGATITQLAKERGWKSEDYDEPISLDYCLTDADLQIVEPDYVGSETVVEPTNEEWNPVDDAINYLNALFRKDDRVNFVLDSILDDDGKWKPSGYGSSAFTAGELVERLKRYKNVNQAIGSTMRLDHGNQFPTTEAGAWIRFNPVSSNGSNDSSISEYRYALVESDNIDTGKQIALIKKLNLPVAAMVSSGHKSIHAIVKIFADTEKEYREKVDRLYKICKKNGLDVDYKNKNPSRLSRLPGYLRGSRKQYLIATNIGAESYDEWLEWVQDIADDLPEFTDFDEVVDNLPKLAPPLIDSVLRQGHKMLIAGPSKAGKSFLLIELAIAIKEGKEWIGFHCAQGNVLYINLEIDPASFLHRMDDVYRSLGIERTTKYHIYTWNLRGDAIPMDKLAPIIIRRAKGYNLKCIIVDPIYKVITGDENAAGDMAKFCNNFDKICKSLGVSVVYIHHHSKGSKGNTNVMDRSSGSGVFARDPDALLDVSPIGLTKEQLAEYGPNCAYRVEGVLREFKTPDPVDILFEWPIHKITHDLKDRPVQGSPGEGGKTSGDAKKTQSANEVEVLRKLLDDGCSNGVLNSKAILASRVAEICNLDKPYKDSWVQSKVNKIINVECEKNGYTFQCGPDGFYRKVSVSPKKDGK